MADRITGTVKWYDAANGCGFITTTWEGGHDVFVHFTEIQTDGYRTLNEGDQVEFSIEESPRGLRAVNVVKLDQSQASGHDVGLLVPKLFS